MFIHVNNTYSLNELNEKKNIFISHIKYLEVFHALDIRKSKYSDFIDKITIKEQALIFNLQYYFKLNLFLSSSNIKKTSAETFYPIHRIDCVNPNVSVFS